MRAEARFEKVLDGKLSLAEIDLEVVPGYSEISFALVGRGFERQGQLEDATEGYLHWKRGAAAGIDFALRKAGVQARVIVHRITGLSTDTSASSTAVAGSMATWRALDVVPAEEWIQTLEAAARQGWERPHDAPVL